MKRTTPPGNDELGAILLDSTKKSSVGATTRSLMLNVPLGTQSDVSNGEPLSEARNSYSYVPTVVGKSVTRSPNVSPLAESPV